MSHPPDDARHAEPIRLHAVTAAALLMRARDVIELRGFDPLFVNGFEDVDLCLRAVGDGPRRFAVVTDSLVLHHESKTPGRGARIQANRRLWMERWRGRLPASELAVVEALGFEVAHLSAGEVAGQPADIKMPRPVLVRPPGVVPSGDAAGKPSLRWAIKTGVPLRGMDSEATDLVCARRLAQGLRRLGQDVVIDAAESNQRATGHLDDVVVGVRSTSPLVLEPGRVNVVWPNLSTTQLGEEEARRYDAVLLTARSGPVVCPGADWNVVDLEQDHSQETLDEAAGLLLRTAIELRDGADWVRPRPRS